MNIIALIWRSIKLWWRSGPTTSGAAIAFYALISLSPLLYVIASLSGWLFGSYLNSSLLGSQLQGLIGSKIYINDIIVSQVSNHGFGIFGGVIGLVTIIVGSVGIFNQLQTSLDAMWISYGDRRKKSQVSIIKQKFLAFFMIIVLTMLLCVSLYLGTVIQQYNLVWINDLLSFVMLTLLFVCLFAFLPKVHISRGSLWKGGILTALLFLIGRFIITWYLGTYTIESASGAAGALFAFLLWMYYCSQVFLFGAALTFVLDTPERTA